MNSSEKNPHSLLALSKIKKIRSFYHQRKKIQLNQLHQITQKFKDEGVTIRSYKGLAFTRQFYPNISFRDSVDIDFH